MLSACPSLCVLSLLYTCAEPPQVHSGNAQDSSQPVSLPSLRSCTIIDYQEYLACTFANLNLPYTTNLGITLAVRNNDKPTPQYLDALSPVMEHVAVASAPHS